MGVLWRYSVIAVGVLAMLSGAFLTMGHLRSREADFTQAEFAKLKAMSSNWEMRLSSVRSAFHDQIWRQDLVPMTEHPDEWTSWRAEEKLRRVQETWINENGKLRGFGFFHSNATLHTVWGDTSGLDDARNRFKDADNTDLVVNHLNNGLSGFIALRYSPAPTDSALHPGQLFLLVDRESVLSVPEEAPQSWILMDGPQSSLYASNSTISVPFQKATWSILLSEKSGIVPQADGSPFGFSRLQLPGMNPLLLLSEIKISSSLADAAGLMILFGGGTLLLIAFTVSSIRRRANPTLPVVEEKEPQPESNDSLSFRQIFQAVKQPLCVVDTHCRLIRVNAAARSLLNVQKGGKPDPKITVLTNDTSLTVEKLLESLLSDPHSLSGLVALTLNEESLFHGTITATRLYADNEGHGPVMLEFFESQKMDRPVEPVNENVDVTVAILDHNCPDPIVLVSEDGIIREFNETALETCERIKDTPLLAEILPGIDRNDLLEILAGAKEQRFLSLFGSTTHEFRVVRTPNGILLYGHPQSDETSLTIALEQAHESFNSLCSLAPYAVVLIDPWSHKIRSANVGAAELLGVPSVDLQDRSLDEFTEISWDDPTQQKDILLTTPDGSVQMCRFDHDLIKIEGEPTLLAVIAPLASQFEPDARELAEHAQAMAGALQGQATEPVLPLGPGLLIVNNPTVREVARRMLLKTGHACETFSSLDDATAWIYANEVKPELVCVDLGDFDEASDWLTFIRNRTGDVPCLALSNGNDYPLPENGLNRYLEKPFELELLSQALLDLKLEIEIETTS